MPRGNTNQTAIGYLDDQWAFSSRPRSDNLAKPNEKSETNVAPIIRQINSKLLWEILCVWRSFLWKK